MVILLFITAKLALYTFWCWYGIRLLAPSRGNAPAVASGVPSLIRVGTGRRSLLGAGAADWLWRLGGVGLSFVGDVAGLVGWVGFVGVIC
jgi:hypothetical protein